MMQLPQEYGLLSERLPTAAAHMRIKSGTTPRPRPLRIDKDKTEIRIHREASLRDETVTNRDGAQIGGETSS